MNHSNTLSTAIVGGYDLVKNNGKHDSLMFTTHISINTVDNTTEVSYSVDTYQDIDIPTLETKRYSEALNYYNSILEEYKV